MEAMVEFRGVQRGAKTAIAEAALRVPDISIQAHFLSGSDRSARENQRVPTLPIMRAKAGESQLFAQTEKTAANLYGSAATTNWRPFQPVCDPIDALAIS
jgi:hypothetical protein